MFVAKSNKSLLSTSCVNSAVRTGVCWAPWGSQQTQTNVQTTVIFSASSPIFEMNTRRSSCYCCYKLTWPSLCDWVHPLWPLYGNLGGICTWENVLLIMVWSCVLTCLGLLVVKARRFSMCSFTKRVILDLASRD